MKDYDLEEAARQYRDEFLDKNDNDIFKYDIEDIFIAGAEWQKEQLIDKACEWLKTNFNMPDDFELHFIKTMED